jgi:hypothetical protein
MKLSLLLPLAALATGCMMPANFGQSPGSSPGSQSSPQAASGGPQAAAASDPAQPSAPVPTEVEVHNDCERTVPLFVGDQPGYGSGTQTSIESNTTTTEPRGPDGTVTIWIVDDSQNGVASVHVTPSTKRVVVGCKTIKAAG